MNVVKLGTLELVSAAISEMDASVLSAKKEGKPDRQAHRHCCPAQSLRQTPATRSLRLISPRRTCHGPVLEHTLTIVCFCGIILAQELVLLSMVVCAIKLYHRRAFSCFSFVTHVLYLNTKRNFSSPYM